MSNEEDKVENRVEGISVRNVFHLTIFNLTKEEYEDAVHYIKTKARSKGYIAIKQWLDLAQKDELRQKTEELNKLKKENEKKEETEETNEVLTIGKKKLEEL